MNTPNINRKLITTLLHEVNYYFYDNINNKITYVVLSFEDAFYNNIFSSRDAVVILHFKFIADFSTMNFKHTVGFDVYSTSMIYYDIQPVWYTDMLSVRGTYQYDYYYGDSIVKSPLLKDVRLI